MTLREWRNYRVTPQEYILNASAVDGGDGAQPFPIGFSVFIVDALNPNPMLQRFHIREPTDRQIANAIFRTPTTRMRGGHRKIVKQELQVIKDCTLIDVRDDDTRLSPTATIDAYCSTYFTVSPRGHGMDCHRNYEAIMCGSIPIITAWDEALLEKYAELPVLFGSVKHLNYDALMQRFEDMLDRTYNFNHLFKSYWKSRRPDVDIVYQSAYWLKRFGKFEHVKDYFYAGEAITTSRANPSRHKGPA